MSPHSCKPALLVFGGLILATWSASSAQAAAVYPGPRTFFLRTFSAVQGFALGDFDEDGHLDAILGDKSLRVARGRGDGFFEVPPLPSPVPDDGILQPSVADFNRDGHLDVAGLGYVVLGRGDGTFGPSLPINGYPGPSYPEIGPIMVAGDFSGDGIPDLINSTQFAGLVFSRGRGDGTFDAPVVITSGVIEVRILAADLNHDGRLDLVTEDLSPQTIRIRLGHGDGTFDAPVVLAGPGGMGFPVVGDIDADGRSDLLVMDGTAGLYVRRGLGDGTLSDPSVVDLGRPALFGVTADLDGDGCDDLAFANSYSPGTGSIATSRSRCDGTWSPVAPYVVDLPPAVPLVESWGIGDVNGDGRMDLVMVADADPYDPVGWTILSSYLGHPDGSFAKSDVFVPGADARSPVVKDMDEDGRTDVALAGYDTDEILVSHGLPGGGFGDVERVGVSGRPSLVAVGDLNGDGRQDLVASHDQGVSVSYALPGGGYSLEARLPGVGQASLMAVLDLDGDAIDDLVLQLPAGLSIFMGRSDNLPQPVQTLSIAASFLGVGDFNGDGHPDLGLATSGRTVGMVTGGSSPLFNVWTSDTPPQYEPSGDRSTQGMAVGDFNEDGREDIAVSYGPHTLDLSVLAGRSDSGFDPLSDMRIEPLNWGPVYAADFDRNGHVDLAVGTIGGAAIYRGGGAGDFSTPTFYAIAGQPVDMNGDGRLDIVSGNVVLYAEGNRPPVAIATVAQTVECTSPTGAAVTFDGSASTDPDSTPGMQDDIATYEWFENYGLPAQRTLGTGVTLSVTLSLGAHALTLKVSDRAGQSSTATATVTIVDTTPPVLDCPAVLPAAECQGAGGANVTLGATAHDLCGGVTVSNDHTPNGADASGPYLLGTTQVGFRATDASGNPTTCSTAVAVRDTLPPGLTLHTEPATLWPPNHGLIPVRVWWEATDLCDPTAVGVQLVSATSSEPDDANGNDDGATTNDIQDADIGTPDMALLLRSERNGKGPGRVYTLTYQARDRSGNTTPGLATVTVPHDQGQGPEPLLMQVEPAAPGYTDLRIYWPSIVGATGYDVITGDLASWQVENGLLNLGTVQVLAQSTTLTSITEPAASATPAVGRGFFYLIQSRTDQAAVGYGTESGPWPRVPASCNGGCPGTAVATTAGDLGGGQTTRR